MQSRAVFSPFADELRLWKQGTSNLASKLGQIAPNGTNLGLFNDQFDYILARRAVGLILGLD